MIIGFTGGFVDEWVMDGRGYRPRAPVPLQQCDTAEIRQRWIRDKGLTVLSLFGDNHPFTTHGLWC